MNMRVASLVSEVTHWSLVTLIVVVTLSLVRVVVCYIVFTSGGLFDAGCLFDHCLLLCYCYCHRAIGVYLQSTLSIVTCNDAVVMMSYSCFHFALLFQLLCLAE